VFVGEPNSLHHLDAVPLSDCRYLVEPVFDRISADAIGVTGQQREIFIDLQRVDVRRLDQRILVATERRVGDASELAARSKR
jgi:hypothetical protein